MTTPSLHTPTAEIGAYPALLGWRQNLQQLTQVFGDRGPEDVEIDVEVVMDEPVAHSSRGCPRNLGMRRPGRFADLLRSLTDDLDELGQPKSEQLVVIEALTGLARRELDGLLGGVAEVAKPDQVVRRRRASLGGDLVAKVLAQVSERPQVD